MISSCIKVLPHALDERYVDNALIGAQVTSSATCSSLETGQYPALLMRAVSGRTACKHPAGLVEDLWPARADGILLNASRHSSALPRDVRRSP